MAGRNTGLLTVFFVFVLLLPLAARADLLGGRVSPIAATVVGNGWLLTPFLQKLGGEGVARLRDRVAAEIKTTFASHYTQEVSLAGALAPDAIAAYQKKSTGEKYLIVPSRDA